jgi:8-oxo-dGTP pyrophosphatase MutT (NUDIX family)
LKRRRHVLDLLNAHRPLDGDETVYVERMRSLLASSRDPFSRSHFDPGHFTVSGFVVAPDEASLLIIRHAKLKRWLQPGGHVETDDFDLASAARREVAEEAGLDDLEPGNGRDVLFDVDIHTIPANGREPRHRHFDLRFRFRARRRDLFCAREVRGVRWAPFRELTSLNPEPAMVRVLRKLDPTKAYDIKEEV